jgi:hypothetical protein
MTYYSDVPILLSLFPAVSTICRIDCMVPRPCTTHILAGCKCTSGAQK